MRAKPAPLRMISCSGGVLPRRGCGQLRAGAVRLREALIDRRDRAPKFLERLFDVDFLALQRGHALFELLARMEGLRLSTVVMQIIEIENLANFSQRKADAAPAQDQDNPRPIARRINPRLAAPRGGDQSFVLVKAERSRRDTELLGQLADGVSLCAVHLSSLEGAAPGSSVPFGT